jgi:hypothetical protein
VIFSLCSFGFGFTLIYKKMHKNLRLKCIKICK